MKLEQNQQEDGHSQRPNLFEFHPPAQQPTNPRGTLRVLTGIKGFVGTENTEAVGLLRAVFQQNPSAQDWLLATKNGIIASPHSNASALPEEIVEEIAKARWVLTQASAAQLEGILNNAQGIRGSDRSPTERERAIGALSRANEAITLHFHLPDSHARVGVNREDFYGTLNRILPGLTLHAHVAHIEPNEKAITLQTSSPGIVTSSGYVQGLTHRMELSQQGNVFEVRPPMMLG